MATELPKTLPAFFWHFIKPHKWGFLVLFIAPAAHALESIGIPYGLKLIVDTITTSRPSDTDILQKLLFPIIFTLSVWFTMVSIFRLQEWVGNSLYPKFQARIRMAMAEYTINHSHQYFSDHFAGSIANKISDMPRAMQNICFFIQWKFVSAFSVTMTAIIMIATINYKISLILITWVLFHSAICYFFAKRIDNFSHQNAEDKSTLQGKIVDVLGNIMNVRLFSRNNFEKQYLGRFQDIEAASNKRTLVEVFKCRVITEFPTLIMLTSVILFLVHGWRHELISAGDFVFVFYASLSTMFMTWMFNMELPQFFSEIGVCKQALSLISQPHGVVDSTGAKPLVISKGGIVFDNVHFQYVPGRDIFKDKSLEIKPGEKIGLVGFSGSGKSTFVNLILRFYDVESGRILIDGQDISEVSQNSLRSAIAMIPQEATLFHRTLMENIRYGRPEATDEEVIEAAKKGHCHEFITELKEGYNALVGERGIKLSGGQRQRIAVARAILKNAPILILDEATSSLDSITEKYIQESLNELMKNRTTIVIAHRLSTLYGMDRILVFKAGRIIEEGNHAALLAQKSHYAALWSMQAGGFLPETEE